MEFVIDKIKKKFKNMNCFAKIIIQVKIAISKAK